MSELLTNKEAKLAWADGLELEFYSPDLDVWFGLNDEPFMSDVFETRPIRLKPRTITINGIEVPAPFEPESDQEYWILSESYYSNDGYKLMLPDRQQPKIAYGAWRTEEEIKQVVAALRQVFKGNQ